MNRVGLEFREKLAAENRRYEGTNSILTSFLEIAPKTTVIRKYFDDKKWILGRLGIVHYLK